MRKWSIFTYAARGYGHLEATPKHQLSYVLSEILLDNRGMAVYNSIQQTRLEFETWRFEEQTPGLSGLAFFIASKKTRPPCSRVIVSGQRRIMLGYQKLGNKESGGEDE